MKSKPIKSSYGSGTIRRVYDSEGKPVLGKSGKQKWRIRICLGTDPITKRVIQKQTTFEGTQSEAKKQAAKLRADYEGIRPEALSATLSGFIPVWRDSLLLEGSASKETIRGYLQELSLVEEYLGLRRMTEITADDIDSALASIKNTRSLSGTTMNKIFSVTKRLFRFAQTRKYIQYNPFDELRAPKLNEPKRRSLSIDECKRFLKRLDAKDEQAFSEYANKERRQMHRGNLFGRSSLCGLAELSSIVGVRLIFATGMRRGEVCALKWGNVDLEAGKLTVCSSLTEKMVLKAPKTRSAHRAIALDEDTLCRLRAWKKEQARALLTVQSESEGALSKIEQTDDTPVCCSGTGGLLNPTHFDRWWLMFRKEAGFPALKIH